MFSPTLPAPFPPQTSADRDALLAWIRGVSLVYGPWKAFKSLFKAVETAYSTGESARETEIFAALMARLENAPFIDEARGKGAAPPIVRGNFGAIGVAGDHLYALEGDELITFDLSAPLEPREIHRYVPPKSEYSYGSRLWIEGERLIYGSPYALRVFSLENPAAPRFLFECSAGAGNGFGLVGGLVFVSDYEKLRVLSLPIEGGALTELSQVPFQYAYNMAAKSGLIALSHYASRNYKITFFDVSDPAAPTQVGQINAQNPSDWRFIEDVLVRIDGENLVFTDLSRPKNPRGISVIKVDGARIFHVAGEKIYVASATYSEVNGSYSYQNKLRIIDVSQLHNPRLLGESDAAATQGMASYQNLLYILDNGLKILDVSDAARLQMVGQRPKNVTFAYLKRRSRRFLRALADADEAAFVDLASAFLLEAGQGRDALFLKENWISAELTLGGGARWHQSSHGRGAYVKDAAKTVIKTREERAPQAWDAHLDAARALWNHPHLPWQTQEMALKILRARGENPSSTPAQISRFLWSDSASLLNYAARNARTRFGELESRAFGPLLWVSNPSQRREILAFIESKPELPTETATHLATLLGLNAPSGMTRRAREIALLLAARFDLSAQGFDSNGAFAAIPNLIASAEAPLRALGLGFCRRLSAQNALLALGWLPQIPANQRDSFIEALLESASRGTLTATQIDKSVRDPEAAIRDAAWRVIAASQTDSAIFRAVWTRLFTLLRRESIYEGDKYRSRYIGEQWVEGKALQSAVNSDAALLTLGRCELPLTDVRPRFGFNSYSGVETTRISAAMWGAYSLITPAPVVIEVVLNAPGWYSGGWQNAWVRANAPHSNKLAAFWNAVQEFLDSDKPETEKQILRERTFEQSGVAATFGGAAAQLSPALLMSLIGAIPDALWQEWRASLLSTLQNDAATREAFWNAARQSPALESGFLRARLLEDEAFAATFGLLETDALVADNPAFTPLLLAWLRAREASLERQSWIEAATHPLPAVRDFGLARLEILGLDVPGALQLLESRLPPSIEFGQKWFTNRGESQLESALALCDSPQLSVRAFGREFIAAHLENLLQNGLIGYLQDNPNAEMQSFVAQQLTERPEIEAPAFDRAVLRSRNRARRAKNLIQERTTQNAPLADAKTLLEIARGRTPRDSEWALTQLARRVLDGANVEGVEIGEVAGI